MKLIKFKEKIEINCEQEFAFNFTQDYNKRLSWDTFLRKAELINGAIKAEKGADAYCESFLFLGMVTTYLTFNKPKTTAIKMTKGPFFIKSFIGSWTFKEIDQNKTEVIFIYAFDIISPFNILNYFFKYFFQRNVQQRLKDLKFNIEKKI